MTMGFVLSRGGITSHFFTSCLFLVVVYHLIFVTGFYYAAKADLKLPIDPPASELPGAWYFSPIFETGFCYMVQVNLELIILLM